MKQKIYTAIFILFHFSCYSNANYDSLKIQLKYAKKSEDSSSLIQRLYYNEIDFNVKKNWSIYLINLGIRNNKPKISAKGYSFLSLAYNEKGDFKKALFYNEKALRIYKKLANNRNIVRLNSGRGNIYYDQMQYDSAEKYYKIAIEHINALPDSDRLDVNGAFINLGLVN